MRFTACSSACFITCLHATLCRFRKNVERLSLFGAKVSPMFFAGGQIQGAEAAHAVMSQHVAQQCLGESACALMSQHVAQQSVGESAHALMSQHVAQQCANGESARALMSQHVAQQSGTWASVLGFDNVAFA